MQKPHGQIRAMAGPTWKIALEIPAPCHPIAEKQPHLGQPIFFFPMSLTGGGWQNFLGASLGLMIAYACAGAWICNLKLVLFVDAVCGQNPAPPSKP